MQLWHSLLKYGPVQWQEVLLRTPDPFQGGSGNETHPPTPTFMSEPWVSTGCGKGWGLLLILFFHRLTSTVTAQTVNTVVYTLRYTTDSVCVNTVVHTLRYTIDPVRVNSHLYWWVHGVLDRHASWISVYVRTFIMRSTVQLSCHHTSFQQPSDLRDQSCIPY